MTAPAIGTWQLSLAARLTDGPNALTIGLAENGLLHVHYTRAGGYSVRQVCTFGWLVERLLAGGSPHRLGESP